AAQATQLGHAVPYPAEYLQSEDLEKSIPDMFKAFIQRLNSESQEQLQEKTGIDLLISALAGDLHTKYAKAISPGQAEAVIRRVLGIKLDSKGRSQLHDLRKKIRKYKLLISFFEEYDELDEYLIKLVFIGSLTDIRTKIIRNYADGVDNVNRLPILGVDVCTKTIQVRNNLVKLICVNTAEEESFRKVRGNYYRGACGAFITFDKADQKSFELVKNYYNEFKENTNLKYELREKKGTFIDVPVVLLGLIGDSEVLTREEGQNLAKELGIRYYEMRETNEQGFSELIFSLALDILTRFANIDSNVSLSL
ncbi:MAG: Rab family GTPase, partial [Candidatus Hodarchaeales archaeon]